MEEFDTKKLLQKIEGLESDVQALRNGMQHMQNQIWILQGFSNPQNVNPYSPHDVKKAVKGSEKRGKSRSPYR